MGLVPNILSFGACLVNGPLNRRAGVNDKVSFARVAQGSIPGVYSFAEMFQVMDMLNGVRDVPREIRPYAGVHDAFKPFPGAGKLTDVDTILVELSAPYNIMFRSCALNRAAIMANITNQIGAVSQHAKKKTTAWMHRGLLQMDESVQAESAEELISLMPSDMPNPQMAKAIIREARATTHDLKKGLVRLRELTHGIPMGVIVFNFRYLPDGRILSWPEGFREAVISVATEMKLPIFDPADLVLKHGVATALRDDLVHYRPEFMPKVAHALADFAQSVFQQSQKTSTGGLIREADA